MLTSKSSRKIVAVVAALCALGFFAPITHSQETRYVSDVLYVPLRSGHGNQYRIINAALRSGTILAFLEESEDGEWAKVQTPNGQEGWIRSQYIMVERPSKMQLAEAIAKIAELEQSNTAFSQKNTKLIAENQELRNSASNASTSRDTMAKELQRIKELSRNALRLEENNKELLEKHQLIQTERDALFAENENLKSDQGMDYMLYGAGLIIVGVILTLIIPSLVPNKSHSEWK